MTFFQRFLSLARADAHGVLDSLEDRSLALRQCLREAELEVARKRFRLEELDGALEAHARQHTRIAERVSALDEDVRLALGRAEDELARYAIRRLLAARDQARQIDERARDLREERERLAEILSAQERELDELRDHVKSALDEERERSAAPECSGSGAHAADGIREEEVEFELLRRRDAATSGELRS